MQSNTKYDQFVDKLVDLSLENKLKIVDMNRETFSVRVCHVLDCEELRLLVESYCKSFSFKVLASYEAEEKGKTVLLWDVLISDFDL